MSKNWNQNQIFDYNQQAKANSQYYDPNTQQQQPPKSKKKSQPSSKMPNEQQYQQRQEGTSFERQQAPAHHVRVKSNGSGANMNSNMNSNTHSNANGPQHTQDYIVQDQGVSYVKHVAVKGATGRKGSLPLSYAQQVPQGQVHQSNSQALSQQYQQHPGYSQHRQSQQYLPSNSKILEQNVQPIQIAGNSKATGKIIKSHAKYFSQQNSPVSKEGKQIYPAHHHQQSLGATPSGIILSSSGAGIIGIDGFQNSGANRLPLEGQQTSQHTTGNFGSTNSHQNLHNRHLESEPRANKNYSQASQHSNGSQHIYAQHQAGYPQKLNQQSYSNQNQMRYSNPADFDHNQHMRRQLYNEQAHPNQVQKAVLGQAPNISQAACNQTVASANTIQSQGNTQNTLSNQTIQNSNTTKQKLKQKYDESFLNGPLVNSNDIEEIKMKNKQIMQQQQMHAKRVINNQSVNVGVNLDEAMMPQPNHKRVLSSQQSFGQNVVVQRANTSSGNYQVQVGQQQQYQQQQVNQSQMNKTEYNQFKNKSMQKAQKFVQSNVKGTMEKSQEVFNKSSNQLSFLNPQSIMLNAQGDRVGIKNMKRQTKAQTRPASNQKVKQLIQNDNMQIARFEINSQIGAQGKKSKNVGANSSVQERRSTGQYKRASPNVQTYYHEQVNNGGSGNQNSMGNLVLGGQNLQYYNGKAIANEMQPQTGMPVLNTSSQQNISNLNSQILNQQQIMQMKNIAQNQTFDKQGRPQMVAVPKTSLHKSSKMQNNSIHTNNYMKQNTIQTDQQQHQLAMQEYNHAQAALQHKRLSTGNIMSNSGYPNGENQDPLSFSMKKQSFHQRAETQLKNYPQSSQYQGHDPMLMREQDTVVGGSTLHGGSASYLLLPHQQPAQQVKNSAQVNGTSSKANQLNMNQNSKYSNSKSQKSSTSRLINSSSAQGRYSNAQTKGSNQQNSSNAGSSDRIPISQRHVQMINNENSLQQNSDNNYGGAGSKSTAQGIASSSSKSSLKAKQAGQKLNTLQHAGNNTSYPYQSSSTKSGKTTTAAQKNSNLSIAQIFQQKGLNYKGPSKVMITQNNANKIAHKMGPNGVIVHTKGIGLKGALTTSANTAQNSPRTQMNKGNMFTKNQNMNSLRRKPSTASIAGASIGGAQSSSSNFAVQGAQQQQQKKLSSSTSGMNRQQQQHAQMNNMRSTSGGNSFKKTPNQQMATEKHKKVDNQVMQYLGNLQEEQDSQYLDDVQVTEIAAYDGPDKMHQLEPSKLGNYSKQQVRNQTRQYHNTNSQQEDDIMNDQSDENINLLESEKAMRKMRGHQDHYAEQAEIDSFIDKQKPNKNFKNSLLIGAQQSSQYIADNGGTGSNPSHQNPKGISQQDFYSQNLIPGGANGIPQSIPQKKNGHSHSLGQIPHMQPNEAQIYGVQKPSNLIMQQNKQSKQSLAKNEKAKGTNMLQNQQKIQKKASNMLKQVGNKNKEKDETEKFVFHDDEVQYRKQLEQVLNDDDYQVAGPLITEEEEQEIRQVASDINEKAFYGKVLKTKQIIQESSKDEKQFSKLSPRSQEIASVMRHIDLSFRKSGEAPETDISYYRIGKMLGRGAFGKVNLAMHKLVRKLVALKSLNKECLTDEVQKQKLMKEVNLLLKLRHDHVVKIYETIETQKHIIIVMELCAGGDLLNYVRKRRRLKEPFAKKIFKQIIDGLDYIHSKHIGHRDIKLDNILLDGKGSVKIGDFGVSKQCQPGVKMREQCGTPAYIAPEILKNKNGYSFNVDLWSAGVVLFAMLYGTVPFKASSMEELHSLILRGVYTLKEDISQEARDMLRGLLEINPHKRLTIAEIYKHPWLADYDESLQLFNDQEREMIKKEYTYNDPSRYNRNENEEPVDCFTEHNIDSVYNTMKNASEKSIILAPFNSTQSEDFEQFKKDIKHMMCEKNLVLRLSRLCREIDRQYEFNNNGQLDNGVYHKQINNTQENKSEGDKDDPKKRDKKKDNSDDEDDESRFQVMQCSKSQGLEFLTEDYKDLKDMKKHNDKSRDAFINNLIAGMQEEERKLIEATFGTNKDMEIAAPTVDKLVQFGYPEQYVYESLQENLPNYVTAGYYLLQMDQNYC